MKGFEFMRSCIYCGRELEKGESCSCAGAVRARKEKEAKEQSTYENTNACDENTKTGWQDNVYRTGYTKKEKTRFRDKFKRAKKFKKHTFNSSEFKSAAGDVSGFAKRFMREPVSAVSNPGFMNMWQIIFIIVFTSLSLAMCGYFAYARLIRNIFGGLAAGIAMPGYGIGAMIESTLYSSLALIAVFFVYLGVLYFVNRFVMKSRTTFKSFIVRPVAAMTPLLVMSVIGILINFFTIYATVMLVMTGIVMWLVLTYEGLRTEWSFASAEKTMYCMSLAFFVFFVVMFNVLRVI